VPYSESLKTKAELLGGYITIPWANRRYAVVKASGFAGKDNIALKQLLSLTWWSGRCRSLEVRQDLSKRCSRRAATASPIW
jgi:hypothetical protein